MECRLCHKKKLTSEYPSNPLSDGCEHHHLLICLRCIIKHVEEHYCCPVDGCGVMIDPTDCIELWECKAKLKQLTFDYSERQTAQQAAAASAGSASSGGTVKLSLTTLLGESLTVELNAQDTVDKLKDRVHERWKEHSKNKIKLLFNGDELSDGQRIESAGLGTGSRVQVLFVLQELTPDLTEVRVSMSWGWPGGRDHTDYLDTACFTFSAVPGRPAQFLHCIDFRTQRQQGRHEIGAAICQMYSEVIRHDGEARKSTATKTSESSFTVWPMKLDGLRAPAGKIRGPRGPLVPVTHLFFVIFTFRDTDIARFRNPRLQVFDQRNPQTPLCSTDLHPRAKGLVVCLLSRPSRRGAAWQVTDVGQPLTEGSIRSYNSVVQICLDIIERQNSQ